MKRITIYSVLVFVLIACSNSANNKLDNSDTMKVDTTVIGSDNPNPAPDDTLSKKPDSLKKSIKNNFQIIRCLILF